MLQWIGETGGGFYLSGKPVIKHKDSTRPSCTEPELYDPMTSSQKSEHIQLVSEQKRSLASKLIMLKERVMTLRGHIALSMFKNGSESVVIKDL